MTPEKHNLPKRLVKGKTARSQKAEVPKIGGKGTIETTWKDIHWTPVKLSIVLAVLVIPFLAAIAIAFRAGNSFIGIMLIGLAVFVGLMYLALRYIEENEF